MKNTYFTVGPSQLYPTVVAHLQQAIAEEVGSLNHRGSTFHNILAQLKERLRSLMHIPNDYQIFFLGSGTEGMERTIQNTVEKKSVHIITGAFSKRWAKIAIEAGKETELQEINNSQYTLSLPQKNDSELVCFTHNETSTGIVIPKRIIESTKKDNPNVLIAIDTVSSAPLIDFDITPVDIVFFSVQKAFGLPAGMGIIIVSPKAMEKALFLQKKGFNIGSYHNFPTLLKYAQKNETPETPPVLLIWLLDKIVADFLKLGIEKLKNQTNQKSVLLYDFFDNHRVWKPAVKNKDFRSKTILVADVGKNSEQIKLHLEKQGLIVGSGYGENKGTQLRIANFPAHTKEDIQNLIIHLKRTVLY